MGLGKLNIFILLIVILSSVLISCSKKRGCADVGACNYDPSAEKNDGSCTYEMPWYLDTDGDGLGDPSQFVIQCDKPSGYVNNANGSSGLPATDFTANDCNGVSHNLYTELDAGLIVVIVWVMPCSSCLADALDVMNIVNSFSTSHPGRVVYYLVDDYGNNPCPSISAWANFYGLTPSAIFSNPAISMSNYGVDGMPKIVATGGGNHQIYFNKNESTVGLTDAINQALIDNP